MALISTRDLDRLLRQKAELQKRSDRQRRAYQQQQLKLKQDEKNLASLIENEQYTLLIKALKQTKFPIDYMALLIGLALEANDILSGSDEAQRTEMINRYTKRYTDFMQESPKLPAAEDPEPGQDASGMQPGTPNEGAVSYAAAPEMR